MKRNLYFLISSTTRHVLLEKLTDLVHHTLFMESVNHCMNCTALSREFAYVAKLSDLNKLTDAKQQLTEHWNEAHSDIFGKLHNDEGMHRES